MGFPENILSDDEQVVRKLNPHWLTVLIPVLLGLVIVALAVVVVLLTPQESPWPTIDWVVIGVGILLLIALVVVPFLKWRTTHYVITTKRVVVRSGILSKSGKDIALSKITDVSFHQDLWDRMLRSGSLTIESAGDGVNEMFSNIPRSNEIQQLINRLVEDELDRRGYGGGNARQQHAQLRYDGQHPESARQLDEHPDAGATQEYAAPDAMPAGPPPQLSGGHPAGPPAPAPQPPAGGWETPPTR